MPQIYLTGTVSYAPDCVFCDLEIDDVATDEYRNYLTRIAKKGAWPTDPRTDTGRVVVRCPICELEYIATVYGFPDEAVEELRNKWVKEDVSVEVSP